MSRRSVIWLVAGREISERVGSRAVRITTVIMTVAVVAAVVVPGLIHSSSKPTRVGLVGPGAQAIGPSLTATASALKVKARIENVRDEATAGTEVKRGSPDVALIAGPSGATAVVPHALSPQTRALLTATLTVDHQRSVLAAAGLPPATIREALSPVPLSTVAIAPPPSHQAARAVAAIGAALFLYLVLVIYGNAVATGVAQEKDLSHRGGAHIDCSPRTAAGRQGHRDRAVGLGQLAIPVIAALIANAIEQSAKIPSDVWFLLPASLLFFALGYALYAFAFAAAGATVARQEEVQITIIPLTIPLLVGYLLASVLAGDPHSTAIAVLSFVPPLTPSLLPARIAVSTAPWWQVILAVLDHAGGDLRHGAPRDPDL